MRRNERIIELPTQDRGGIGGRHDLAVVVVASGARPKFESNVLKNWRQNAPKREEQYCQNEQKSTKNGTREKALTRDGTTLQNTKIQRWNLEFDMVITIPTQCRPFWKNQQKSAENYPNSLPNIESFRSKITSGGHPKRDAKTKPPPKNRIIQKHIVKRLTKWSPGAPKWEPKSRKTTFQRARLDFKKFCHNRFSTFFVFISFFF